MALLDTHVQSTGLASHLARAALELGLGEVYDDRVREFALTKADG